MDLKKAFIPVFMSLFLISLATPFLTSAAQIYPPGPKPYPGPSGPSWYHIPFNSSGSTFDVNQQGYSFSLSDFNEQQNVSSVSMSIKIPSTLDSQFKNVRCNGYQVPVLRQNAYGVWVALSPYTGSKSGTYFTQAGVAFIATTSAKYLELFAIFANGTLYKPFYQQVFRLSEFAGQNMSVKMQYTGNSINVVFSTSSFHKQVSITKYLFTPHSGLIIGEIPELPSADINGYIYPVFSYPIPNDTFSVNFEMKGGLATNGEVYTFYYNTGHDILSSVVPAGSDYNSVCFVTLFQWIANSNSYSEQAIANYTSSTSCLNANITLHYEETPPVVCPLT